MGNLIIFFRRLFFFFLQGKLLPFLTLSSFHVVSRIMDVGSLGVYFDNDRNTNGKIYRSICRVYVNREARRAIKSNHLYWNFSNYGNWTYKLKLRNKNFHKISFPQGRSFLFLQSNIYTKRRISQRSLSLNLKIRFVKKYHNVVTFERIEQINESVQQKLACSKL